MVGGKCREEGAILSAEGENKVGRTYSTYTKLPEDLTRVFNLLFT